MSIDHVHDSGRAPLDKIMFNPTERLEGGGGVPQYRENDVYQR